MENDLFITIGKPGYKLVVQLTEQDTLDEENDNVDLKVYFDDGRIYSATVFTLKNIQALLERYKETGECLSGLYFYTVDMLIVERLTIEIIERVIGDLIDTGEYKSALRPLIEV